jgi:uncharacterized protein (DUF1697 family)
MPRYAAFLRGINVSGRRVGGADLRRPFEAIGLREVASFRASGNVVFEAGREQAADLAARIERELESALGYDVAVFLRNGPQLTRIVASEPFPPAALRASKGKLQVTFLSRRPSATVRRKVLALAGSKDLLEFGERELFWLPSGGTQESELDTDAIGTLLGSGTMRTKGTVEQLTAKFFAG